MADLDREMARAARQLADQQTAAVADVQPGTWIGTVTSASPLQVSWRGRERDAYRCGGYTPNVGDRVLFTLTTNQLVVIDRIS